MTNSRLEVRHARPDVDASLDDAHEAQFADGLASNPSFSPVAKLVGTRTVHKTRAGGEQRSHCFRYGMKAVVGNR